MRFVLLFLTCAIAFAQNPNTAVFPSGAAGDGDLYVATNGAQTTLNGTITSMDSTIVLTSGTKFVAPVIITIESEVIHCTTLTTNTLSGCTRGAQGTTAASHSSGATVYGLLTAWHHNQVAAEIKAIETNAVKQNLTSISAGGSTTLDGNYYFQKITLTASATVSSVSNLASGEYKFIICVPAGQSYTWTWSSAFVGGMTIADNASGGATRCNTQHFDSDGTTLYASTLGVTGE